MNLHVITGDREYLIPRTLPAEPLLAALRALEPRATLPVVRFTPEPTHDQRFLYADPVAIDARVALFLEYLEDTVGKDDLTFVLLPVEPDQVLHFLRAAEARFGAAAVHRRRVYLSDTTQAVIRRLQPDAEWDIAGPGLALDLDEMRWNYTCAVLRLAEPLVAAESLFEGDGRAARVAQLLEDNGLLLRSDLGPDRIEAALHPGGELFELMARPVPAPTLGLAATLLATGHGVPGSG